MSDDFSLLKFLEEGMNETLAISEWKNFTVSLSIELDNGPDQIVPTPILIYEIKCRDLVHIEKEPLYHLRPGKQYGYYGASKMEIKIPGIGEVAKRAELQFKELLMKKFLETE